MGGAGGAGQAAGLVGVDVVIPFLATESAAGWRALLNARQVRPADLLMEAAVVQYQLENLREHLAAQKKAQQCFLEGVEDTPMPERSVSAACPRPDDSCRERVQPVRRTFATLFSPVSEAVQGTPAAQQTEAPGRHG